MSSPVRTVGTLVWDLPVRLFHWLLAAAILGAWVTHKMGTGAFAWHRWFGYACLVLVAFRIVWGFVGTCHARFADFLRGPAAMGRYARNWLSPRSVSHLGIGIGQGRGPGGYRSLGFRPHAPERRQGEAGEGHCQARPQPEREEGRQQEHGGQGCRLDRNHKGQEQGHPGQAFCRRARVVQRDLSAG